MLLMVEKRIRGVISQFIYRYTEDNNKQIKDYDKSKESPYLQYWDGKNLYGCTILQKLPVNNFEQIKDTPQFNEDFLSNYDEETDEGLFLKVDVPYLEKLYKLYIMIYYFYQKEQKLKKSISL